jgi:sigma-E factor negative regulatory protein RseC
MIEESATVVAIEKDNITVTSEIKSACSGCQQVDNCGSGQVAKAFPQKRLSLTVKSTLPLQLGDKVIIGLNETALLSSAWQVYLWPLFGLLILAWFGQWLVNTNIVGHEGFAILFAMIGGYVGFLLAKNQQSKREYCTELSPKIVRRQNQNITITEITD